MAEELHEEGWGEVHNIFLMTTKPSVTSVLWAVWYKVNLIYKQSLQEAKGNKDRVEGMDALEAKGGGDTIRMDDDTAEERRLRLQSSTLYALWDTFRKLCLSKPEEIASSIESVLSGIRNGIVKDLSSILHKPEEKYIGINYHELAELIWLRYVTSLLDFDSLPDLHETDRQDFEAAFQILRERWWQVNPYEDNWRVQFIYS